MKLVEILARDLKVWPKNNRGNDGITQDEGGNLNSLDAGCEPSFHEEDKCWEACSHSYLEDTLEEAEDFATAVVTKAQWQAERDRQKGGEWKRHRGGKCPVKAGTQVSTKHRDGKVVEVHHHTAQTGSSVASLNGVWKHNGDSFDIMSYRVISQPQAEEVEVKDTTIGTLSYKVEIDTTEESQAIDALAAKWDQVDGPLRWRDTVNELDAYIEEFTREREALINRLAEEGFALIPPVVSVMSEFSGVDLSDWRNWRAGDVVECLTDSYSGVYTKGRQYKVKSANRDDFDVFDDLGEQSSCRWGDADCDGLKFVSRP